MFPLKMVAFLNIPSKVVPDETSQLLKSWLKVAISANIVSKVVPLVTHQSPMGSLNVGI
jgi:hypothetical protein